jgi:hypothetical protein
MDWQVCIDQTGVQMQLCLGDNDKIALKQRSFMHTYDKLRIKYLFNGWTGPQVMSSVWYKGTVYEKEIREGVREIAKKYGAEGYYDGEPYYQMRKSSLSDYIEVIATLDAKNYDDFGKKYSGIDGAIEILSNTKTVLRGAGVLGDAAGAVNRMIRKLEFEKEN